MLTDGDGAALIVDTAAEDYVSQPSRTAEARLACTVLDAEPMRSETRSSRLGGARQQQRRAAEQAPEQAVEPKPTPGRQRAAMH
ncbi:hypothetical protein SAMN05421539_102401 [Jannaschia seohaensis]|uniref:Uncharacterized protein n=1 Tax=Jannaschia seohaensis TaxID=475081 RepID=A0A2Y9AAF9_9RHOB|nr:hypothetical protein BCF38_102401 [Jannaschia seohaensis]SSA41561.1 hypothetical protein SAMN05421539_102401 [Jannaschia seohaensis]